MKVPAKEVEAWYVRVWKPRYGKIPLKDTTVEHLEDLRRIEQWEDLNLKREKKWAAIHSDKSDVLYSEKIERMANEDLQKNIDGLAAVRERISELEGD